MKEMIVIGADISKATIDLYSKPLGSSTVFENTVKGFKAWLHELKKVSTPDTDLLVVMEHTGRYSRKFENFLSSNKIGYCKVPALQIKRSMGLVRGKSDKIDAKRIAEYAWMRRDILIADQQVCPDITTLKDLWSLRSKLVRDRSGYMNRLKEMKATELKADPFTENIHKNYIKQFTQDILQVEEKIKATINSNTELQKNFELICSIKGVGLIVATYMLVTTNNFEKFDNARKFNCYAGIAPFKYESGTSIKGRSRVSHLANKAAKTLLNMSACIAIRYNPELKNYYQKRVAEGKRKMSCLNIIRSKIVARMFAVVRRQSPYEELALTA
ncbi:MAG: IS110 family transposase [Sphingobacteriales bacterium]|nr:MAG: IS110 family transposase [Sphingobacteriales bacterium]